MQHIQEEIKNTSPNPTVIFHGRLYGKFKQIGCNRRRKKLHRLDQGSNLLGSGFFAADNESSNEFSQRQNHLFSHQQLFDWSKEIS